MEYGFVYCIGNDCMPGVYKVGMTDRAPSRRCDELSASTSVPEPFDLLFFIECADPRRVEQSIHRQLTNYRVSDNREFFRCDLRIINRIFTIYKEDGCAYAETNSGETELAMLDYHSPEPDESESGNQLPDFLTDDQEGDQESIKATVDEF